MIRIENRLGTVGISTNFFAQLVSHAAANCCGVAVMVVSGASQGLRSMAGGALPDKGVLVRAKDGRLEVELHIEVAYGVNIAAVVRSLVSEVRYAVETVTGLRVDCVNVFVDAMKCE